MGWWEEEDFWINLKRAQVNSWAGDSDSDTQACRRLVLGRLWSGLGSRLLASN